MSAIAGPSLHSGMVVKVVEGGAVSAGRFLGRSFSLWGHAEWFSDKRRESGGWWSWPVPDWWNREVATLQGDQRIYIPETHLVPEYDGRCVVSWDHSSTVWRPLASVVAHPLVELGPEAARVVRELVRDEDREPKR